MWGVVITREVTMKRSKGDSIDLLTFALVHRSAFADADWMLQLLRINIQCKDETGSWRKQITSLKLKCEKWRNQEHMDFAASPPAANSASIQPWQMPQLQKLIIVTTSAGSEPAQLSPSRTCSSFLIQRHCVSETNFHQLAKSWELDYSFHFALCWLILENNQRQFYRSVKWVPPAVYVRVASELWAEWMACSPQHFVQPMSWPHMLSLKHYEDVIANYLSVMMPSPIHCPLHISLKHWNTPLFFLIMMSLIL